MEVKFRKLSADEIDIRAAKCNEKGASLLLYKDARCDMNILDETVGPMNWQRHHSRENANCIVSIWDDSKGAWISKEDTGTESNTEAEKGLASDSFKRACVNWGIGRELYTAPFIWVSSEKIRIEKNYKGKFEIKDELFVSDIQYDGNSISSVEIKKNNGMVVFCWSKKEGTQTPDQKTQQTQPTNTAPKSMQTQTGSTLPGNASPNQEINYVCVDCKMPVKDYFYDNNKKYVRAATIIARAKERFGVCMCYQCLQKAVKNDTPRTEYDERALQEVVA